MIDDEQMKEIVEEIRSGKNNTYLETVRNRLYIVEVNEKVKNLENEIAELKKNKEKNER